MSDAHTHPGPPSARGLAGPPLAQEPALLARETTNALGSFLRARRELVTPGEAGIPDGGVRRVPGLRREEVAMLAGISADYYLRLERGRDRHPSAQVLDALARVLRLDDEHTAHLHALAAQAPRARGIRPHLQEVPPSIAQLVAALAQPAYVEGRYFDVLASNPLARALDPRLTPGGNQLRDLFLDPAERDLYQEWEGVTACVVSSLRQAVGGDIEDPGYQRLVADLSRGSIRFRELWARHEVAAQRGARIRFDHPELGPLTLNRERLSVSGAEGLMLVIYHPDPGSSDAEKLALLASAGLPTRRS